MVEDPTQNRAEAGSITLKQEKIKLALELFESGEVFPFPGINPESHSQIQVEQEEFPGYTTPIDELLVRFQNEGMKVVLTKDQHSGNILVLPGGSDDIENDFLLPRNLSCEGDIDKRLLTLILNR